MLKIRCWLLALLLFAGCGTMDNNSSGWSNLFASNIAGQSDSVFGLVRAQAPLAGARVNFVDLSGRPGTLPSLHTDGTGFFNGQTPLPADFRVIVTPTSSSLVDVPLILEVRGYSSAPGFLQVNLVTTLVSAYLQTHPGTTLQQAEVRVRSFLSMPPGYPLTAVDDTPGSPFAPSVFMAAAARNGGLGAFLQQLAAQVDGGVPMVFVLNGESKGFFASLLEHVATDYIADGAKDLIGWGLKSIGVNFGFSTTLRELANELDTVLAELEQLTTELAGLQSLQTAIDSLEISAVAPTKTATQQLILATNTTVPTNIPTNAQLSPAAANATNSVINFQSANTITLLYDFLLGRGPTTNIVYGKLATLMTPVGASSDPAVYQGYPLRANLELLNRARRFLVYYQGISELAINLEVENSHLAANLAQQIRQEQLSLVKLRQLEVSANQQLPAPLTSNSLVVDMESGLMWYNVAFAKMTFGSAQNLAASFNYYGYSGWRLPYGFEVDSLYGRCNKALPGGPKRSKVLTEMGFDLSLMDDNHRIWALGNLVGANSEVERYSLDDGDTVIQFESEHNNVLLVRSFPSPGDELNANIGLDLGVIDQLAVTADPTSSASPNTIQLHGHPSMHYQTARGSSPSFQLPPAYADSQLVWLSSDDKVASVSNFYPNQGLVTFHYQPNGGQSAANVTITARFSYPDPQAANHVRHVDASIALARPAQVNSQLVSISITPYNARFAGASKDFGATLFYQDPTSGDRMVQDFSEPGAPALTWSVVDTVTNLPVAGAAFNSTNTPNRLILDRGLPFSNLTVRAVSGSVTGTANITYDP